MEIIDSQVHPMHPAKEWSGGLSEDDALAAGMALLIASMDAVGVRGGLLQWWRKDVAKCLALHPDRFAGVPFWGWPEPEPERPADYIDELAAIPGIVGTRLVLSMPPITPGGPRVQVDASRLQNLRQGGFDDYLAASQRRGLAVFITATRALPALHDAIRAHPDLVFVLDHLGLSYTVNAQPAWPEIFDEIPDLVELAQFPNVAVKFSGVPAISSEPYPFADLWPHLAKVIDAFGVDRLMWGSDFTRCSAMHTYRESVDFLLLTDRLSTSDKEMIFAGAMRKWLGWPSTPALADQGSPGH